MLSATVPDQQAVAATAATLSWQPTDADAEPASRCRMWRSLMFGRSYVPRSNEGSESCCHRSPVKGYSASSSGR